MVEPVIEYDEAEWSKMTETFRAIAKRLLCHDNLRRIGGLVTKHFRGVLCSPQKGSFNACLQMKFRLAIPLLYELHPLGMSMFPDGRWSERSVIRYLAFHTNVLVPYVLHYGRKEDCPAELDTFTIMEYVRNEGALSDALNTSDLSVQERPILNPNNAKEKLQFTYG